MHSVKSCTICECSSQAWHGDLVANLLQDPIATVTLEHGGSA